MKNEFALSESVFFTTREFAVANDQLLQAASRTLARLALRGVIQRVTKGIWANTRHPFFTPLGCVPFLLRGEQGYVSFLTALHRHGVISQIPPTIQIATTGHARRLKTPIGTFEFLSLKPRLMTDGVVWCESRVPYRMATAEKALLDTVYVSTRKGRRFVRLPELDLELSRRELLRLARAQVPTGAVRSAVMRRFEELGLSVSRSRRKR